MPCVKTSLREKMRALGLSHRQTAVELSHRYQCPARENPATPCSVGGSPARTPPPGRCPARLTAGRPASKGREPVGPAIGVAALQGFPGDGNHIFPTRGVK